MNKKKKHLDEITSKYNGKIMYVNPNAYKDDDIAEYRLLPDIQIIAENPYNLTDYQKAQASKIKDNFRRGQYLKEQDYYNKTGKNKFTEDINYIGTESQKRLANVALSAIPGIGTVQPFIKYENGKVKGDFSKEAFIQSGINTVLDFIPVGDLIGKGVKNTFKSLKTAANKYKRINPSINNSVNTDLINVTPLNQDDATEYLLDYIRKNNINPKDVKFKRSYNNPYATPINPAEPDGKKHIIYGFELPLNPKTKKDIMIQSLPRLNKLLGSDYSSPYTKGLNNLNERILIHHNRKQDLNVGGYYSPRHPYRINKFTDDLNPNTTHHEAMHAVFNNLDDATVTELYNHADKLFNENGLAIFSSDPTIGNLFKKQTKLANIAFDNSKSKNEAKQAIDEFSKLEEIKKRGLEEILTTVSESRATILKDKINPDASIDKQNRIIDLMSDEKILEAFKNANGYSHNYIQQILENNGGKIPKFFIDNLRTAYKTFPVVIPAVINNKNKKQQYE